MTRISTNYLYNILILFNIYLPHSSMILWNRVRGPDFIRRLAGALYKKLTARRFLNQMSIPVREAWNDLAALCNICNIHAFMSNKRELFLLSYKK